MMKRMVVLVACLVVAGAVSAGDGKSCDMKAKQAKSVTLEGKVVCADGDCDKAVFRVSDRESYDVCHKSKASLKALGASGQAVKVTGKLVSCDEGEGQELVIETAKSI
jgi:hypothetical protein